MFTILPFGIDAWLILCADVTFRCSIAQCETGACKVAGSVFLKYVPQKHKESFITLTPGRLVRDSCFHDILTLVALWFKHQSILVVPEGKWHANTNALFLIIGQDKERARLWPAAADSQLQWVRLLQECGP